MKEHIEFVDSRATLVSLQTIEEYPIHCHDAVEIIYVLEGVIDLKISFFNFELREGQFAVINRAEIHRISKKSLKNLVLIYHIDASGFNIGETIFMYDPSYYKYINGERVDEIRRILINAALESFQNNIDSLKRTSDLMAQCLAVLIDEYQMQHYSAKDLKESIYKDKQMQSDRMKRINNYLYAHYNEKIGLEMLAELEHINKYYLTHLIKYSTGYCFQKLINIIRIEMSEGLLLNSEKNVSDIVYETGFSSYRFFNKHFKELFHMTPSEYRQRYKNEILGKKAIDAIEYSAAEGIAILYDHIEADVIHDKSKCIMVDGRVLRNAVQSGGFGKLIRKLNFFHTDLDEAAITLRNLGFPVNNHANISNEGAGTPYQQYLGSSDNIITMINQLIQNYDGNNLLLFDAEPGIKTVLQENHGVIARTGLAKVSFYACLFYAMLGDVLIDQNDDYLVTGSSKGFQILIHCSGPVKFKLTHVCDDCLIKIWHYENKNNTYNQCLALGKLPHIDNTDIDMLNRASFPHVQLCKPKPKPTAEAEFEIQLSPQDTALIIIEE